MTALVVMWVFGAGIAADLVITGIGAAEFKDMFAKADNVPHTVKLTITAGVIFILALLWPMIFIGRLMR